jgi:hypothetical protein
VGKRKPGLGVGGVRAEDARERRDADRAAAAVRDIARQLDRREPLLDGHAALVRRQHRRVSLLRLGPPARRPRQSPSATSFMSVNTIHALAARLNLQASKALDARALGAKPREQRLLRLGRQRGVARVERRDKRLLIHHLQCETVWVGFGASLLENRLHQRVAYPGLVSKRSHVSVEQKLGQGDDTPASPLAAFAELPKLVPRRRENERHLFLKDGWQKKQQCSSISP